MTEQLSWNNTEGRDLHPDVLLCAEAEKGAAGGAGDGRERRMGRKLKEESVCWQWRPRKWGIPEAQSAARLSLHSAVLSRRLWAPS